MWSEMDSSNPRKVTTQMVRGEPFTILKEHGVWLHGEAAHYPGKPGFVLRDHIGRIPTGEWITGSNIDPADWALDLLDTPYKWGGMTEEGIDCSGLVHRAYRQRGVLIPRDATDIEAYGTPIRWEELDYGDLITYGSVDKPLEGPATHIGFYMPDGGLFHAEGRRQKMVLLEDEPDELKARRRKAIRIPF